LLIYLFSYFEQQELERQKRDIEKQIFEQSEKLKKEMEINLVRDVYYVSVTSSNNKIRKTTIRTESGEEIFRVDLSNWEQRT